jgi:NAD(P)-dependent dehydrogenase (short-subunit alcohol dehydrogenase family)
LCFFVFLTLWNIMVFEFDGQVLVLTGASGFLGSEIARGFIAGGGHVIGLDRCPPRVDLGASFVFQELDLSSEEAVQKWATEFSSAADSRCDVLVHCAAFVGTSELPGWNVPWQQQSNETWNKCMTVNVTCAFVLGKALFPLLQKSASPSVVFVSSIYGDIAPDMSLYEGTAMNNPIAYGCSKAALNQLCSYFASLMGAAGVRVNAVAPGGIARGQNPLFVERYCKKTLLGRMATEPEIAEPILFLMSSGARYITGQLIHVDGGFSTI